MDLSNDITPVDMQSMLVVNRPSSSSSGLEIDVRDATAGSRRDHTETAPNFTIVLL